MNPFRTVQKPEIFHNKPNIWWQCERFTLQAMLVEHASAPLGLQSKKTPGKHQNLPTMLGVLRPIMPRQPHLISHAYLLKQKCLITFNNRSKIVYCP